MKNTYKLLSIGNAKKNKTTLLISIDKSYIKGLKNLSFFSHITILFQSKDSNIFFAPFSQCIVKITEINEKEGTIISNTPFEFNVDHSFAIYDIKPYFPNEDRIKKASLIGHKVKHQQSVDTNTFQALGNIHSHNGLHRLKIYNNFSLLQNYIAKGTHIKIFWRFHRFDKQKYKNILISKTPYENSFKMGVFASRSPIRPNAIAMTTARIVSINSIDESITVSNLDCFNNTPLLGISLYDPQVDCISEYTLPPWLMHWSGYADEQLLESNQLPILEDDSIQPYRLLKTSKKIHQTLKLASTTLTTNQNKIVVQGAKQNNLKNIHVEIPYGKITVITGVSGSGKSSLAFDTILAESQQNFFSNISISEKKHLNLMERPNVDSIKGLPPAICINQKNSINNPRSTLGTLTNIYDLLRSIYATIGKRHCPKCGKKIERLSIDEIVSILCNTIDGTCLEISPIGQPNISQVIIISHPISADSITECVSRYLTLGHGAISVCFHNELSTIFQTTEKCYHCNYILFELTTTDFSHNNLESSCPKCHGIGITFEIDIDKIIDHPKLSILDSASSFWGDLRKFLQSPNANWMKGEIIALAKHLSIDLELPWEALPELFRTQALFGTTEKVSFSYINDADQPNTITRPVEGAFNIIQRILNNSTSKSNSNVRKYLSSCVCTSCNGERLKLESRIVCVSHTRFPEAANMSIEELKPWVFNLPSKITDHEFLRINDLLQEMYNKLSYLCDFNLGYLNLNRPSPSLSGGELQRVILVNQLHSKLSNILYILDEPSNALHPKDYEKLISIIKKLTYLNNTILLVEHTPSIIKKADYIIDIGGGSGEMGGHVVACGSLQEIIKTTSSITGQYLSKRKTLSIQRNELSSTWVNITNIRGNNLKNVDICFPLYSFICLTGVSGSGKSSLMKYGIIPALTDLIKNDLECSSSKSYSNIHISDTSSIHNLVYIDQTPIGRSSRSTPATYTGITDAIRKLFASTSEASKKGYTISHFSFNHALGQCSLCKGYGYQSLHSLSSTHSNIVCPSCNARKFNPNVLKIKYKNKSIHDIYNMSIQTAFNFFEDETKIRSTLSTLIDIGLGYLKLGQSSQTLSGGEAQRIKLANRLAQNHVGGTVYLFDEPTSGLHYEDIQNLLLIFKKLNQQNHTVILVEHNLDVASNADWIIDLGKEGGSKGGHIIVQGTPEDVRTCNDSYTGNYL